MNHTEDWIARRLAVVARGVGMFAGTATAARARGSKITDADGDEWIDFAGGIGVMNAGHCNDEVVAAIREQAGKLLHTCIHVATYEPYVLLCEELVRLLPHGDRTKCMLVNSGAEAVENAIKIARQATRRPAVIAFEGAFHGRTLLGMTLTAKTGYKKHCGPFAAEVYHAPAPNYFKYGSGLTLDAFVASELRRFEERFITGPVPAEHVAAIIIEPVQGEGGFIPIPTTYLQGLRRICDHHGILMICDEVQTGFCRTGRWGAFQHAGFVPDLSTWAKSLGGGLPIGAVVGKAEIMDAAEPGTIGGTYGGNPVACAAALASVRVLEKQDLNARATHVGRRIRERLEKLRAQCSIVGDVRGLGAMMAVELCHAGDPARPATNATKAAAEYCRAERLLVLTAGPFGNVLRILCPLVITDDELDRGLEIMERSILRAANESC